MIFSHAVSHLKPISTRISIDPFALVKGKAIKKGFPVAGKTLFDMVFGIDFVETPKLGVSTKSI